MLVSSGHFNKKHTKGHDLSKYSWHTGAKLRKIDPDENCPVLFRDLGPVGMVNFLEGKLTRLAGPMTPLTYMRDSSYDEPYVDYAEIGRIIFLKPHSIFPWFSGVDHVYVTSSSLVIDTNTLGFLPNDYLRGKDAELKQIKNCMELSDYIQNYHDFMLYKKNQLKNLNLEHTQVEKYAHPLRLLLQTGTSREKENVRKIMSSIELNEDLLCRAFHHIKQSERKDMYEKLKEMSFLL